MKNSKNILPKSFKPYLWSYVFEKMDLQKHKKTIILSILNFGNINTWKELFRIYGKDEVKKVFYSVKKTEFDAKTYSFWNQEFTNI